MRYSSSSYHIRPNCETPTFHFLSLKSSENGPTGRTVALVFGTFALTATLLLRLASRVFALRLLLFESDPRLASAMSMTTSPPPITTSAAKPPRIHQIAFDFLRGGCVGDGDHCCCGGGGGGGGAGRGVTSGGGG